jgi:hypothetical protein
MKWRMTYALGLDATTREIFSVLNNRILPEETAITLPNEILAKEADNISPVEWNMLSRCLGCRRDEARINIMAEFLENCSSIDSDQADETMRRMNGFVRLLGPLGPTSVIHYTHQVRLAKSIHSLYAADPPTGPLYPVFKCWLWSLYAEGPKTAEEVDRYRVEHPREESPGLWPWLDDPFARQKIKEAFAEYQKKLTLAANASDALWRVQRLLRGIDSWHPERDLEPWISHANSAGGEWLLSVDDSKLAEDKDT